MVLRWYTFRLAEHYFWYTFSLAYALAITDDNFKSPFYERNSRLNKYRD